MILILWLMKIIIVNLLRGWEVLADRHELDIIDYEKLLLFLVHII